MKSEIRAVQILPCKSPPKCRQMWRNQAWCSSMSISHQMQTYLVAQRRSMEKVWEMVPRDDVGLMWSYTLLKDPRTFSYKLWEPEDVFRHIQSRGIIFFAVHGHSWCRWDILLVCVRHMLIVSWGRGVVSTFRVLMQNHMNMHTFAVQPAPV